MNVSDMNIFQKLSMVQCELKAPKNQYNSFGKYPYRSCEDILEAIKPLLSKYELCSAIDDDVVSVGSRIYIKSTVTLYNLDKSESKCVSAFARESETKKGMDEAQITGSASSYARKYALNGMFLIDDTKDADSQDNTKPEPKKATVKPEVKKEDFSLMSEKEKIVNKIKTSTILTDDNKKQLRELYADIKTVDDAKEVLETIIAMEVENEFKPDEEELELH